LIASLYRDWNSKPVTRLPTLATSAKQSPDFQTIVRGADTFVMAQPTRSLLQGIVFQHAFSALPP
jgi:hypothetical protein